MDGVEIKVYADAGLIEAANIALCSTLYVPGWSLSSKLERIRRVGMEDPMSMPNTRITIAYKDGEPIAVAVTYRIGNWGHIAQEVQAFVRPTHRRQGLGTKCVRALNRHEQLVALEGIEGSLKFWDQLGVDH